MSAKKSNGKAGKLAKRTFEEVPVDLIEKPKLRLRTHGDEEKMEELRLSIKQRGVLVPLIVRRMGRRYELIAGQRRFLCAAAIGLATVPAIVVRHDRDYELWAQMAENRLREPVNPLDEAYYIAAVLASGKRDQAQAAALLGVSPSYVSQRLAILRWPDPVKQAVRQGWVSFAVGRELVQIENARVRAHCLENARLYGCTVRQAAMWRRNWQRDQADKLRGEIDASVQEEPGDVGGVYCCLVCEETVPVHEGLVAFVCTRCRTQLEKAKSQQSDSLHLQPTFFSLHPSFSPLILHKTSPLLRRGSTPALPPAKRSIAP